MILHTTETCPKCKVVKMKLEQARLEVEINQDISKMEALGIQQVPVLELDNGSLLDFPNIIKYIAIAGGQK